MSTSESEYIALSIADQQIACYTNGSNKIGLTSTAIIYCYNTAAISISENPGSNSYRTKHIDIHYHFVKYVDTSDNLADICTKGLAKALHERLTSKLMY